LGQIISVTKYETEDKGDRLHVIVRVIDVPTKLPEEDREGIIGGNLHDFIPLKTTTVWRIRQLCEAALGHAPSGKVLQKEWLVGKRVCIQVEDNEYQGEVRSRIVRYEHEKEWLRRGGSPQDTVGKVVADDEDVDLSM